MKIEIILEDDFGSVIAKRSTENWGVAEMNLDSLKRWWQSKWPKFGKFRNEPIGLAGLDDPRDLEK